MVAENQDLESYDGYNSAIEDASKQLVGELGVHRKWIAGIRSHIAYLDRTICSLKPGCDLREVLEIRRNSCFSELLKEQGALDNLAGIVADLNARRNAA